MRRLLKRLRTWLGEPYRDPVRLPVRAQFLPDAELEARLERAHAPPPEDGMRRLIEPQPDGFVRFGDVPEDAL